MPVSQLDDIYNRGSDVLGTTQDSSGTILAQTGDVVGEDVDSDNAEWWQHVGFVSRPAMADSGKAACQAVTLNQGSNDIIVATRDLRAPVPRIRDGETALYAPGPSNQGTLKITLQDDGQGNATATIYVNSSTQVIVQSNGTITIKASAVNIAGASDYAALASKVDDNFNTLVTALTTATSSPGGGTLTFPSGTPTVASTAASEVKIS